LPIGIEPQHPHFTAGARPQALKDFYGGSFSGPVWSKQSEDFTSIDLEIDAADGFDLVVRFAQILDGDNR
jgi:hypothetical protein